MNKFLLILILGISILNAGETEMTDQLPVRYEELTATDFARALEQSAKTCLIPLGIMEKHGPHLPIGTDLINIRAIALSAAEQEYVVVFPQYFTGQIFEAKHQPGTIAYSHELIWNMLQETCDELARNGFEKILLVNGHGGNNRFLDYFCQAQLEQTRDYVVFLYREPEDARFDQKIKEMQKSEFDYHGGELETSLMMAHRPDLVRMQYMNLQSGEDQARMQNLKNVWTGIWWYARFPNHYAGNARAANAALGKLIFEHRVSNLARTIKLVKQDQNTIQLQKEFFKQSKTPLKTGQKDN